jgi:hypothetical protein
VGQTLNFFAKDKKIVCLLVGGLFSSNCLFMKHLDKMFSQFAEAFLGNMAGDGDIPFREKLNLPALNYSLSSLNDVDHYLKYLYSKSIDTSSIEYQNVVVWCGSYIGEVIRRNAIIEYHWVHYEEHMKGKDQNIKNLIPYMLGTHAFLVATDSSYVTMPINKVARFLGEGEENNVHFYASGDIFRKQTQRLASETAKNPDLLRKPWWKFW